MHFLLFYDVVDNYTEKRKPVRAAHFAHAQKAYDAGQLVLAGALEEPVDGAVLVFRGPTSASAEAFAKNDPYVLNGLVKQWRVRKWSTVLGDGESLPKLD
ncbi:MAG: YciI family protein [Acidobacteriaceae bacterium]|nr:YciI family protein [Acidobacteriaceae bacterium]